MSRTTDDEFEDGLGPEETDAYIDDCMTLIKDVGFTHNDLQHMMVEFAEQNGLLDELYCFLAESAVEIGDFEDDDLGPIVSDDEFNSEVPTEELVEEFDGTGWQLVCISDPVRGPRRPPVLEIVPDIEGSSQDSSNEIPPAVATTRLRLLNTVNDIICLSSPLLRKPMGAA